MGTFGQNQTTINHIYGIKIINHSSTILCFIFVKNIWLLFRFFSWSIQFLPKFSIFWNFLIFLQIYWFVTSFWIRSKFPIIHDVFFSTKFSFQNFCKRYDFLWNNYKYYQTISYLTNHCTDSLFWQKNYFFRILRRYKS